MLAAFVMLSFVLPATNPPKFSEAAQKELKKLEGKWKIVKAADSIKEAEAEANDPDIHLVFKGNELTLGFGEKKETLQITALDPGTDPKCIDLLEKRSGKPDRTNEGVYKIDGDMLQIALCIPRDGKQRPISFAKPTDTRTMVWTLKRVKE